MDTLLTPLLAEEAARPDFVYRAVYPTEAPVEGKGSKPGASQPTLSPLLAEPPEYVLLHFEVHPDGTVLSPQCPTGAQNAWACDNGASADFINAASSRLAELQPALSHAALLNRLPWQPLPVELASDNGGLNQQASANIGQQVIANSYSDYDQSFAQQQAVQAPNAGPQAPLPQAPPTALFANPPGQAGGEANLVQAPYEAQPGGGQSASYNANVQSGRFQRSQSRSGNDLTNREAALQAYAQREVVEQRFNYKSLPAPERVVEGVSRPLWLGDRLILARRVQMGDETVVQGCWLDWQTLQTRLKAEVADLLPRVELTPVQLSNPLWSNEPIKLSRLLATIPVQLTVEPPAAPPAVWTPIRTSLVLAWACLLITALAAGVMLNGVITLSERRGAFVSAVTHELRTPLTTFRMYAEMLADGMVPEPAQRQQYLQTLRIEADRLAHLVENVLQYARLERGRPGKRREEVSLGGLLHRFESRLADRAAQAEMKLEVEVADEDRDATLATDSAAVEQIVFNLVDNACKYAAAASDKRIHLAMVAEPKRVRLTVRDHGPGISRTGRKKLFRPFSKSVHEAASTAPGVGLGLALSRRLAADLGGRLELETPAEGGAAFVLTLPTK
jgi:signal transduction histidine kinase